MNEMKAIVWKIGILRNDLKGGSQKPIVNLMKVSIRFKSEWKILFQEIGRSARLYIIGTFITER